MIGLAPVALDRKAFAARSGSPQTAAPVRIAHLGLGAFHRSHQAWYTSVAGDSQEWGIAAFTGRKPLAAEQLQAQDGLYSLVVRSADADRFEVVGSISEAVDGSRVDRLIRVVAAPTTALVTLTITEGGYTLDAHGRPDTADVAVAADVAWLRQNLSASAFDLTDPPRTAFARLLAGIEARRRNSGTALAIVSCDNMPDNGEMTRAALVALAEVAGARATLDHLFAQVSFVSTSVDRITPQSTTADAAAVAAATGWHDRAPVVTEPFHDWVLCGDFPAGRPDWESGGAQFVDDIDPFERRKLWMLNGSHTLMAYAGAARGHRTVADAIADPAVREWVEQFWDEAVRHLPAIGLDLPAYRAALLDRFENARIQHLLAQIGQDGTTKLRVRIVPVLRAERSAGRDGAASIRVLAAWVAAAQSGRLPADRASDAIGAAVAEGGSRSVAALVRLLDAELASDPSVVDAITRQSVR